MDKHELRIAMKQKRKDLTMQEITEKSNAIAMHLFSTTAYLNANCVMVYMDAFGEPQTCKIVEQCFKDGKSVVVPVSNTHTNTLSLSYIYSLDDLRVGAYGILEPKTYISALCTDIDIILVPGIAFDLTGNRIGFGKGYYDRLLTESKAVKIGICYEFQINSPITPDTHDIPMDIIITEKKIHQCGGSRHHVI